MKVTLDINNDAELRTHIKEAINGQIASIVRDEYYAMVKVQIDKKVSSQSGQSLEYYLKEALSREVKELIKHIDITKSVNKDFVIPIVEKRILEAIENKDWNKLVDDLAKEKVKSLLK